MCYVIFATTAAGRSLLQAAESFIIPSLHSEVFSFQKVDESDKGYIPYIQERTSAE